MVDKAQENNFHQWRYSPDRALASLTGFMIVIVRCGLSAPRLTWFYTPRFSHQRHLVREQFYISLFVFINWSIPNVVIQCLAFLLCILEVLVSILGSDTSQSNMFLVGSFSPSGNCMYSKLTLKQAYGTIASFVAILFLRAFLYLI
jgi:hypothetical protein